MAGLQVSRGKGSYLYGMLGLLGWTVLSKAACCFFRITSASFCLTTLLATAPAGVGSHDRVLGGWTGGLPVHSLPVASSTPLVQGVPGIPQARAKPQAPPQTPPAPFPSPPTFTGRAHQAEGDPGRCCSHPSLYMPRGASQGHWARAASILTSLTLVLVEKLPQLLLLLPHRQLGHRCVH